MESRLFASAFNHEYQKACEALARAHFDTDAKYLPHTPEVEIAVATGDNTVKRFRVKAVRADEYTLRIDAEESA